MKKIIIKHKAKIKLQRYFTSYISYYEKLYEDSGVWSEKQILESCKEEAKNRYDHMINAIIDHLQNDFITYPNNEVLIRWRTKVIIVKIFDENNLRIIEDLEIR